MIDWNFHSRAHACQACGQAFTDQQPYHTVLRDAKHEYQRQDVCEPCWTAQQDRAPSEQRGFISHWQGVYEAPPAAPPDPIKKETAESLLRTLMEKKDPQYRATSYILAVMLERKRLLKIKTQSQEDGVRIFVYEQPKTGDLFVIPDPNLQLNQLEEVQRQLAHLLEHGVARPVMETPAPAAGEPAPTEAGVEVAAATEANAALPPEKVSDVGGVVKVGG